MTLRFWTKTSWVTAVVGGASAIALSAIAWAAEARNRLETFSFDVTQNRIEFATLEGVEPTGQVIADPTRIVIDLPGTIYEGKTVRRTIGRAVQAVRVGRVNDETTRLVVEFAPNFPLETDRLRLQARSPRHWSIQLPESVAAANIQSAALVWPLVGTLTAGFGWRIHPITNQRRLHKGIDIAAPIGTPILAAADGTVVAADWDDGYGNFVELQHADGNRTLYAHAHRLLVQKGMTVRQNQAIAEVGSTGRSTGPHLHFEVLAAGTTPVDPMAFLPQRYVLFDVAAR
ncbi:MAG: peptidoglycan DD-metalloendopeptidase family protein [Pseudanabaenaceae cyanobacterium]